MDSDSEKANEQEDAGVSEDLAGFTSEKARKPRDVLNRDLRGYISEFHYNPEMDLIFHERIHPEKYDPSTDIKIRVPDSDSDTKSAVDSDSDTKSAVDSDSDSGWTTEFFRGKIDLKNITEITIDFKEVIDHIKKGDESILEKLYRMNSLIALTFKYKEEGLEGLEEETFYNRDKIRYYYIIHQILYNNSNSLEYLNMGSLIPEDDILLCKNLKQINMDFIYYAEGYTPTRKQSLICELLHLRGCITPIYNINIPKKIFIQQFIIPYFLDNGEEGDYYCVYQYLWYHPEEKSKFKAFPDDDFFEGNYCWAPGEALGEFIRDKCPSQEPGDDWLIESPDRSGGGEGRRGGLAWYIPAPLFLKNPENDTVDFSMIRNIVKKEKRSKIEKKTRDKIKEFFEDREDQIDTKISKLKMKLLKALSPSEAKKIQNQIKILRDPSNLKITEEEKSKITQGVISSEVRKYINQNFENGEYLESYEKLIKDQKIVGCYRRFPGRPEFAPGFERYLQTTFWGGKDRTDLSLIGPMGRVRIPPGFGHYEVIVYEIPEIDLNVGVDLLKRKCDRLYISKITYENVIGGSDRDSDAEALRVIQIYPISNKLIYGFGSVSDGNKLIYRWR